MVSEDQEAIVFCTPKDIFYYKVILFGLKNIEVTFQRAMQTIFDEMLHKTMKCYVDNLVVKSNKRSNYQ